MLAKAVIDGDEAYEFNWVEKDRHCGSKQAYL